MNANNFHLKLKQSQQLNQAMHQSLRVLQMSGLEFEQEIEEWLQDNPLLERAEATEQNFESPISTPSNRHLGGDHLENAWENLAVEETLHSFLHKQVCEHPLAPQQAQLIHIIIDFLDEHGYLTDSTEDILEHTPLDWFLSEDDVEDAIEKLREFEPAGIATANLNQSLLHQLSAKFPANAQRRCAAQIISYHLTDLCANQGRNIQKLKKKIKGTTVEIIQSALEMIGQLHPYPAYGFANSEPTAYTQPDVFVHKTEKGWQVSNNENAFPQIKINEEFAQILKEQTDLDPIWREHLSEAHQRTEMLAMRKSTILRVSEYIVARQTDFFDFGEIALIPMLLKECAQELELAESTISRAVSKKYLACPQGIFPLRYFFSKTATVGEDNENISASAIKSLIAQLIEREDKSKPYADLDLHKLLKQQGINITRRTIAKYRDQLGIPATHLRKP